MYNNGYLIGHCHHQCDRFSGGFCSCGGSFNRQSPSESVEVQIVPQEGLSAFETWKAYYGLQYPEIQTEKQWIDSGYGGIGVYEEFEI